VEDPKEKEKTRSRWGGGAPSTHHRNHPKRGDEKYYLVMEFSRFASTSSKPEVHGKNQERGAIERRQEEWNKRGKIKEKLTECASCNLSHRRAVVEREAAEGIGSQAENFLLKVPPRVARGGRKGSQKRKRIRPHEGGGPV